MTEQTAPTIYLADYRPPDYLVDSVHLTFRLRPADTRVIAKIHFRPNPVTPSPEFVLDGLGLQLLWAKIDGQIISPQVTATGLSYDAPQKPFLWECEVEIAPDKNSALDGLYQSPLAGAHDSVTPIYCSQCEAEGFRKITYYPDRPDVMASFTVRIESDLPVLLSNGNLIESGPGYALWHDPWPKPSYLFALVAGELAAVKDQFVTASGRMVQLAIFVRPGDEARCVYAMDALKRAMAWDERVYGREYDLDTFNIVAVDDFNMGAMENKGLNIFNSKYILASPETATDRDYELIESIIAHEYFHNWTGNRITCRDWFQLCLKEGLTVYRDQQFSGDMHGHGVKRIEDVSALRARQFREDAGPLAHPVRPDRFVEINNFYTATVYEKGAELIRMLHCLLGDEGYYAGCQRYFERHDGHAVTIEDWIKALEEASGTDLTQFVQWYRQAGTPVLEMTQQWRDDGTLGLNFAQHTAPTPDQAHKEPLVIPIRIALLRQDGTLMHPEQQLIITQSSQDFTIENLPEQPVVSALRGFSAPVLFKQAQCAQDRAVILAHDSDLFNRWDAGRQLAKSALLTTLGVQEDSATPYIEGLARALADPTLDPSFRAQLLSLPSEENTAQALADIACVPDPGAIHHAHNALKHDIATRLEPIFERLYDSMETPGPYRADAAEAGRRKLRLAVLDFLSLLDKGERAQELFDQDRNMTQTQAALRALITIDRCDDALDQFYQRWHEDRLVIDKWFMLQAGFSGPSNIQAVIERLTAHRDFDWKNPNRFRAVFGALGGNHAGFHLSGGKMYQVTADWLIRLDAINPQTAARMTTMFETYKQYDSARQVMMRAALERIAAQPKLSTNAQEMVARLLTQA